MTGSKAQPDRKPESIVNGLCRRKGKPSAAVGREGHGDDDRWFSFHRFVARALVLRVAFVTPAVVEDHRAPEDGPVPALRSTDCYLPDGHELVAAPRAPVVNHVVSLSQPSASAPFCNGTSAPLAPGGVF